MASHPEMQSLVNGIVERNARRGLSNPATLHDQDRNDILALHNKIRAETARGEYQGSGTLLPQATNMNYLKWSTALETVAAEWSSNCQFNHRGSGSSSCATALGKLSSVDLPGWSTGKGCGENLYGSGVDPVWTDSKYGYGIMEGIEDGWCKEEAETWTYGTNIGSAGHYTQVVWANTEYVGCGFYNCPSSNGWMNNMFTCNYYPPGNYGGQYAYTAGSTCSDCSGGCSTNQYTPQSGTPGTTPWNLAGLCTDGSTDDDTGGNPVTTASVASGDSGDDSGSGGSGSGDCLLISGMADSSFNGEYCHDSGVTQLYQSGTYYLEMIVYGSNSYWGFYRKTASSPDWSNPYCSGSTVTSCSWTASSGGPSVRTKTCSSSTVCDGGSSNPVSPDPGSSSGDPCVVIDGWSSTSWGGNFDDGQWEYISEYEGYNAYKWSEGTWYLYAMPYYKYYTISQTLGAMQGLKGWCSSGTMGTNLDVLDCDGVWMNAANVIFSDCDSAQFVFEPCLDDAADFVHFTLDDGTMSFELHSEVGCFNNEPVWKHTASDDVEWFIHFDSANGAWLVTMHYVQDTTVYQCISDDLAECGEGSWVELFTPETDDCTAVNASYTPCSAMGVRELETARVDLAFDETTSDDEAGGLSAGVIVVIVLLVLMVLCVGWLVWWKRSKRMGGEFEFKEEPTGIGMETTAGDVQGGTVDMESDEEN